MSAAASVPIPARQTGYPQTYDLLLAALDAGGDFGLLPAARSSSIFAGFTLAAAHLGRK